MIFRILILSALVVSNTWGQRVTDRRTADIHGGGGDGKCTIEVVVDDVAEVEIRGREATIRTFSGSPASFRRFQCNQELPTRPNDFRFQGIDGRGRQDLVRRPDFGPAVIRIEDPKGGTEGYTFDIFWRGGSGGGGGYDGGRYDRGRNDSGRYDRGGYDSGGYNRPGYGNSSGWNNGWGSGSGWVNNSFRFEGGRNGAGSYEDRYGARRRLDSAMVTIGSSGDIVTVFQSDRGRVEFKGRVERRDGRRVYAQVEGSGMNGYMEIEMSSPDTIRQITMSSIRLSWFN